MNRSVSSMRTSNRFKHGLTSRFVSEARASEVKALARVLLSGAPFAADVQKSAEALAESIMSLNAIRSARFDLLSRKLPTTIDEVGYWLDLVAQLSLGEPVGIAHLDAVDEWNDQSEWGGLRVVLRIMALRREELHRLEEYERKAFSRFNKCLMRFDHAVIDSRRQSRETKSPNEHSGWLPGEDRLAKRHRKDRMP